jgi:large subunit ribosomal protein L21
LLKTSVFAGEQTVYAVVRIAGKQFQVRPETVVRVPRLAAEVGSDVEFDEVLAVGGEDGLVAGRPRVDGARVVAEVLGHARERTVLVFHKKRRKDHRKKNGHRQPFTNVRIRSIQVA